MYALIHACRKTRPNHRRGEFKQEKIYFKMLRSKLYLKKGIWMLPSGSRISQACLFQFFPSESLRNGQCHSRQSMVQIHGHRRL